MMIQFFGVVTFNQDTIHGLLKNELTLFHHLHVKLKDYALPLTWWKSHETRFPNVSFVAPKKPNRPTFNIVRVLTSLQCCRLGVDNLDKFIMIMKNWLANAHVDCPREGQSFDECFKKKGKYH
jgi:hypothetical protein